MCVIPPPTPNPLLFMLALWIMCKWQSNTLSIQFREKGTYIMMTASLLWKKQKDSQMWIPSNYSHPWRVIRDALTGRMRPHSLAKVWAPLWTTLVDACCVIDSCLWWKEIVHQVGYKIYPRGGEGESTLLNCRSERLEVITTQLDSFMVVKKNKFDF